MCRFVLGIVFACFSDQIGAKFASHSDAFPSTSVTYFPKVVLNYPLFCRLLFCICLQSLGIFFPLFSYCNIFHVHFEPTSS